MFFGRLGTAGTQTNDAALQQMELRVVVDRLRAENADLKAQGDRREVVIRKLQESLAVARTESELFQQRWMEAQVRAQTLGANPADREAVAAQRELVETVRRLFLAEAERQRLVAQLQRLLGAVQSNANVAAEAAATQALLDSVTVPAGTPARKAAAVGSLGNAKVLDVNPQLRVAVLDVGAQQGARVGMPFQAWRDDRLVAELRVVEVRPRVCGALIERVEPHQTVRVGDEARAVGKQQ